MKKFKVFAYAILITVTVTSLTACGENEKSKTDVSVVSETTNLFDSINSSSKSEISEISQMTEKILDPFENLNITYTGTSPYIVVSTDNSLCNSVIKENFDYQIEDKKYRNGDSFEVTAIYDSDKLKGLGYSVVNDKKSYTITEQPEFITNIDGLDLSAMQSEIEDKLTVVTAAKEGDDFFADFPLDWIAGYKFSSYKNNGLKSAYLISLKTNFEDKYNSEVYNRYMLLYDYNVTSKRSTDDIKEEKRYIMIIVNNISRTNNGNVSWNINLDYKSSDNYDDLITDQVISKKEYYNVTELNITKDTWGVPKVSN